VKKINVGKILKLKKIVDLFLILNHILKSKNFRVRQQLTSALELSVICSLAESFTPAAIALSSMIEEGDPPSWQPYPKKVMMGACFSIMAVLHVSHVGEMFLWL